MQNIISLIYILSVFVSLAEYPLGRCASHRSCLVGQDLRSFILEKKNTIGERGQPFLVICFLATQPVCKCCLFFYHIQYDGILAVAPRAVKKQEKDPPYYTSLTTLRG